MNPVVHKLPERRGARRLRCDLPTMVQVLGPRGGEVDQEYERVEPPTELMGQRVRYTVRVLSGNGAFLEGPPLPLLSRVRFSFALQGRGPVEVEGWVMGRRCRPTRVKRWDGEATLPPGIGVLFDLIPLPARIALSELAHAERQGG